MQNQSIVKIYLPFPQQTMYNTNDIFTMQSNSYIIICEDQVSILTTWCLHNKVHKDTWGCIFPFSDAYQRDLSWVKQMIIAAQKTRPVDCIK